SSPEGNLEPAPGPYVSLSVRDTGIGMPPAVVERAFEPFFTTKGPGTGSGLGLSMVYGFAKQSGGHARIESGQGGGPTGRIFPPRSDAAPESRAASQAAPAAGSETAGQKPAATTILVVEDDHGVRGITVARLEELGYQVIEADCGKAALEVLTRGDVIDLM